MKIAIFIPSLEGGGAERVAVTIANNLIEYDFNVDLLLVHTSGPYLRELSPKINIINFNKKNTYKTLFLLVKYLSETNPYAMLSFIENANIVAILAKLIAKSNVHLTVSERNNPKNIDGSNILKRKFLKCLCMILYPFADNIHAVSYGVRKEMSKFYKINLSKIKVVYNPISVDYKEVIYDDPKLNSMINKNISYICAAGRLAPQKDFETLIRAFFIVKQHINIKLIIIGEGELRDYLLNLIEELKLNEYVYLPGFINSPFTLIRNSKLFVLSSAWEGLPNVLLQAMQLGVPVVSTDCEFGPSEILQNGKWGKLVHVGDHITMAQAIIETLESNNNPDVKRRAQDFNLSTTMIGYMDLLNLNHNLTLK